MTYTWYELMDIKDLDQHGLVSKEYTFFLQGIGNKDIILFKGNYYSILYEGIFLTFNLNDREIFPFEGHAITIIDDIVYLGIEKNED